MTRKMNLVFLGPPGAGKGTLAQMLSKEVSSAHISTGDILREEIKNETELGKKAKHYVTTGGLVPDELVADMVGFRLTKDDCAKGFILDGFPRTVPQAKLLEDALKKIRKKLDLVIYFKAGEELLLKRLTARITCRKCNANFNKIFSPPKKDMFCDFCEGELYQRADDSLETAKSRLKVYSEQTEPLISYYEERRLLVTLNAELSKNEMFPNLLKVII